MTAPTVMPELTAHLMAVTTWMRRYYDARFEELGLTAATARALLQLDPKAPLSAGDLAYRLSCDPSNVTGLVDRLEAAGFVERRSDPRDRRVRALVLTPKGRRMRRRMTTLMAEDMPPLYALPEDERQQLSHLVTAVWAACQAHDAAAGATPGGAPGAGGATPAATGVTDRWPTS